VVKTGQSDPRKMFYIFTYHYSTVDLCYQYLVLCLRKKLMNDDDDDLKHIACS